ncbi:hypothetical protein [Rufibacter soli]
MGESTRLEDFKKWIEKELFKSFGFNEEYFLDKECLFSIPTSHLFLETLIHSSYKPTSKYSQEEINEIIFTENRKDSNQDWAIWFHVPYHDQIYFGVTDVGIYDFGLGNAPVLSPLYYLMEHKRAEQNGIIYAGILSNEKKWCLLMEYNGESIEMNLYK